MVSSFLKSMTAYGRASQNSSLGRFVLEIQCLNRKFLEINISMPKEFLRFDIEIRKWIAEKVTRGQINVSLFFRADPSQSSRLIPNMPLAKSLKGVWGEIAKELNVSLSEDHLLRILSEEKDVVLSEEFSNEDLFKDTLKNLVKEALDQVLFMKQKEGEAIVEDVEKRLQFLERTINEIEEKTPLATQKHYLKLKQRLEELFSQSYENEEKLMREVAIYAERVDISEEMTRFRSHLKQFRHFLQHSSESQGKTIDFLIQELNREMNTIGSKCSDASVAHLVVFGKSELEKIREQIQNVE